MAARVRIISDFRLSVELPLGSIGRVHQDNAHVAQAVAKLVGSCPIPFAPGLFSLCHESVDLFFVEFFLPQPQVSDLPQSPVRLLLEQPEER